MLTRLQVLALTVEVVVALGLTVVAVVALAVAVAALAPIVVVVVALAAVAVALVVVAVAVVIVAAALAVVVVVVLAVAVVVVRFLVFAHFFAGARGGNVSVVPHRHEGVFIVKGKDENIATLNLVPGFSVYGEKRVQVDKNTGGVSHADKLATTVSADKIEYRIWNPFRSKLAAAIVGGVENIYIKPGTKLLYLGAASGTTVSHCSDLVGPEGVVYAVEISQRSGRDLIEMAKKRTNIIPIIEDARHPLKYRMLVGMVDVIFQDVAQPDQARIMALNAQYFLKPSGHFVISIKANCIDSTVAASVVFAKEVEKLQEDHFKPEEQITLEPFERDHAVITGTYLSSK